MNFLIPRAQAQSLPTNGPVIQRTIVDETTVPASPPTAVKAANTSVFYGLGAILMVIIAIGAALLLWDNFRK